MTRIRQYMFFVFWRILWIGAIYCKKQISIIFQIIDDKSKWSESSLQVPKKIWRFSSAHFYREVISQINNLWYNILEIIIKGWVVDHRERAESIVSWSGLHLKYNAIFFYAGAGESASCQFFAASSERSATFFTTRVQWKLWKVHLNYPIDTLRSSYAPDTTEEVTEKSVWCK